MIDWVLATHAIAVLVCAFVSDERLEHTGEAFQASSPKTSHGSLHSGPFFFG
jgi:hypothetical protein